MRAELTDPMQLTPIATPLLPWALVHLVVWPVSLREIRPQLWHPLSHTHPFPTWSLTPHPRLPLCIDTSSTCLRIQQPCKDLHLPHSDTPPPQAMAMPPPSQIATCSAHIIMTLGKNCLGCAKKVRERQWEGKEEDPLSCLKGGILSGWVLYGVLSEGNDLQTCK